MGQKEKLSSSTSAVCSRGHVLKVAGKYALGALLRHCMSSTGAWSKSSAEFCLGI